VFSVVKSAIDQLKIIGEVASIVTGLYRIRGSNIQYQFIFCHVSLARMFHESLAATLDMAVLPGVLGS